MVEHYLRSLFNPESVAVIGVSERSQRGGNAIFRTLREQGFEGRAYAVGRSGGRFDGESVHTSIADLPEVPTLVFSAVGKSATPQTLIDAATAGVKVAIVFTAGFAEMSADGAQVQRDMISECNRLGMRVVGPNCMGVFDRSSGLNLTSFEDVETGPVGLVSQSGNIALTLFDHAGRHDLGFRSFVSFGNQADIPAIDYIEYMGQDDAVEVILLYLESLQECTGADFVERCRAVARRKPVVAIKGGVTDAGRRAAASHTSRLSATADIYDAAFEQAGIVQVHDLDHVLAVTEALVRCPSMKGGKVAIVGSGGGHSTVGTDCVERAGLEVPAFSRELEEAFGRHLPPWAPMSNPVDMTGGFTEDLTMFETLMRYPLSTEDYDGGLSYGMYGSGWKQDLVDDNGLTFETAAPLLGALQRELGKPIVFYTPYGKDRQAAFTAMRASGVPCYGSLSEAAAALSALKERGAFLERGNDDGHAAEPAQPTAGRSDGYSLTEYESLRKVAAAGLNTVGQRRVSSPEQAVAAAAEFGYPVVLKAQLANVAHKSDVNGVRLGLTTAEAVAGAFNEMRTLPGADDPLECTVSQQLPVDREILLGIRRDETFGHTVVVAAGGVLTEVAARSAVIIPPVGFEGFEAAIVRSPIKDYLGEWRGRPAVDLKELHRQVTALHRLCVADPAIQSVDVNPLATAGESLTALDATVVLQSAPDSE